MYGRELWARGFILALVGTAALPAASVHDNGLPLPTNASPIAITSDDTFVWSVNPDRNSVSVFRVKDDANAKLAEIPVGREPWCVAITPDDEKVYVTNMASGTVSVISQRQLRVVDVVKVGTEPFGCALTPDGRRLFVTNQSSGTVSVISTTRDQVIDTIRNVGSKPHGIAITADGARVYVTQFLALKSATDARPLTQSEGADDGREGRVTVIDGEFGPRRRDHCAQAAGRDGFHVGRQHAGARAAHLAASARVRQRHRGVSEPARVDHDQGEHRVHSEHVLLAERPVQIQRERAKLPVHD